MTSNHPQPTCSEYSFRENNFNLYLEKYFNIARFQKNTVTSQWSTVCLWDLLPLSLCLPRRLSYLDFITLPITSHCHLLAPAYRKTYWNHWYCKQTVYDKMTSPIIAVGLMVLTTSARVLMWFASWAYFSFSLFNPPTARSWKTKFFPKKELLWLMKKQQNMGLQIFNNLNTFTFKTHNHTASKWNTQPYNYS